MAARLRVTQVKSTISHIARNRATIRALGLKRIGHTVEIPDNPATRGMVRQVRFLVSVEEEKDARQSCLRETEYLLSQVLLGSSKGSREERQCLGEVLLCKAESGKVIKRFGDFGIVLDEGRFPNR